MVGGEEVRDFPYSSGGAEDHVDYWEGLDGEEELGRA